MNPIPNAPIELTITQTEAQFLLGSIPEEERTPEREALWRHDFKAASGKVVFTLTASAQFNGVVKRIAMRSPQCLPVEGEEQIPILFNLIGQAYMKQLAKSEATPQSAPSE